MCRLPCPLAPSLPRSLAHSCQTQPDTNPEGRTARNVVSWSVNHTLTPHQSESDALSVTSGYSVNSSVVGGEPGDPDGEFKTVRQLQHNLIFWTIPHDFRSSHHPTCGVLYSTCSALYVATPAPLPLTHPLFSTGIDQCGVATCPCVCRCREWEECTDQSITYGY